MDIKTKYNIGDIVWAICVNDVRNIEIKKIEITAWNDSLLVLYADKRGNRYYDEDLYLTKKEAYNHV